MRIKILFLGLFCLSVLSRGWAAQDIVGIWKSIDDKTGAPQIMVAIYEYQNKYFGQIIALYDDDGRVRENKELPKKRASGVKGDPFFCGLDFIYNLEKRGEKYSNGKILDPKKGKAYNVKLWLEEGNLIVRGELLIFGRSQTWLPVADTEFSEHFKKPDLSRFIPTIPQGK